MLETTIENQETGSDIIAQSFLRVSDNQGLEVVPFSLPSVDEAVPVSRELLEKLVSTYQSVADFSEAEKEFFRKETNYQNISYIEKHSFSKIKPLIAFLTEVSQHVYQTAREKTKEKTQQEKQLKLLVKEDEQNRILLRVIEGSQGSEEDIEQIRNMHGDFSNLSSLKKDVKKNLKNNYRQKEALEKTLRAYNRKYPFLFEVFFSGLSKVLKTFANETYTVNSAYGPLKVEAIHYLNSGHPYEEDSFGRSFAKDKLYLTGPSIGKFKNAEKNTIGHLRNFYKHNLKSAEILKKRIMSLDTQKEPDMKEIDNSVNEFTEAFYVDLDAAKKTLDDAVSIRDEKLSEISEAIDVLQSPDCAQALAFVGTSYVGISEEDVGTLRSAYQILTTSQGEGVNSLVHVRGLSDLLEIYVNGFEVSPDALGSLGEVELGAEYSAFRVAEAIRSTAKANDMNPLDLASAVLDDLSHQEDASEHMAYLATEFNLTK